MDRHAVSPFDLSQTSSWWWLISSVFLIRISCHKTTHANGYYGAWPGWAVSISVLPLTFSLSDRHMEIQYIVLFLHTFEHFHKRVWYIHTMEYYSP